MKSQKKVLIASLFAVLLCIFACITALTIHAHADTESEADLHSVGDVYIDGAVNSKDAIFMMQYLAGAVDLEDAQLYRANTYVEDNGGNKPLINSKDAILLLQSLAGMDVQLGRGEWVIEQAPTEQNGGMMARNNAYGREQVTLPKLNEYTYEKKIVRETSCLEAGRIEYILQKDGQDFSFFATTPMIEHTIVVDPAVEATCIKTGLTEGSHCSVCGTVFNVQAVVPLVPHKYSSTTWKCTVCGGDAYYEYASYGDYRNDCIVKETNGVVTILYNGSESISLNLNKFVLENSKTYLFEFGVNATDVKISSNGVTYSNVRIVIDTRSSAFNLVFDNISLQNYNTVVTSHAATLNIGFYGSNCWISTTKGATGSNGESYGALQIGNGGNGRRGADANIAVVCSGKLNITCGANTVIRGGDGGNGGNGGNSDSSGSTGGTGGNGGNGAMAIKADQITVSFVLGKTKSNISIQGGYGGSGGSGGYGSVLFGSGKKYASNGSGGNSATATNVTIKYI